MATPASSSSSNIHGMAAKIRAATESEAFDLGGLPPGTIETVIHDAFEKEWPAIDDVEMIRITLIVGAGKQSRQKYHENTPKLVTSTLNDCGYNEDRGASNVAECAGLYKLQHDTGKNLKTVVVFPKFEGNEKYGNTTTTSSSTTGGSMSTQSRLLLPDSMEYKVAISSMPTFQNMLQHKVSTWFQKRNLMHLLEEDIQTPFQELERILLKGQSLTNEQQELYDACVDIDAKHVALKHAMQQQVDDGKLTAMEKEFLLSQVQKRIDELQQNSNGGANNNNNNNNNKALQKAKERKTKLQSIVPIPLPPLKHAVELGTVWKQAAPLLYLQSKSIQQQQLSLQETKKLGQLDDYLAKIDTLEQDSRGWLEDDDVFEARIQAYRRELQQKYKTTTNMTTKNATNTKNAAKTASSSSNGGGGGGGGGGGTGKKNSTTNNAWSSTTSTSNNTKVQLPMAGTGWMSSKDKKAQALQSKKAKMKKGDVFGAMMMDDSESDTSDDEVSSDSNANDDDDNDDIQTSTNTDSHPSTLLLLSSQPPVSDDLSHSSKNNGNNSNANAKKKKQKNKTKKQTNNSNKGIFVNSIDDDDRDLTASVVPGNKDSADRNAKQQQQQQQQQQKKNKNDDGGVLKFVFYFLEHYLFPFLVAVLTWILSCFVRTSNSISKTSRKNHKQSETKKKPKSS
ncbi:hypothetical protein IV203_025448 [Nitzschia inconspicua]|uniref:Uncharacterized protein n=1 Tax=Nitzschia inconspicua TaxID=303405 RepID=A0A9K3PZ82_9STRA|nr:hypothetical protein IV203_028229 [Nitzschia inconspicua]KAG7362564.1 hypothetical protein IV203_025448 [Nitzschia inconspicua]